MCLAVLLGGVSLFLTFRVFGDRSPFAYISYVLPAYGLTVLTAAAVQAASAVKKFLHGVPVVHRYLTDRNFSARCGLAFSFLINLG